MNLYCNCYECLYQDPENRLCKKDASEIFIDEEGECSEYFYYTLAEEYRQEFYIARKDGFKGKRYGKKVELSGHTFFYTEKVLTDYTLITEEKTGVGGFYYGFKEMDVETLKMRIDCMLKEHGYVKDKPDVPKNYKKAKEG